MHTPPNTLAPKFDTVPNELVGLAQWVLWSWELKRGQRKDGSPRDGSRRDDWTKPPSTVTGTYAATNNPETWNSFETVRAQALNGHYAGIGFCLSAVDHLSGLDLDHCVDPQTLEITRPDAAEIVRRFSGTWIERSPSGDGLRIWCHGKAKRSGKAPGASWIEAYTYPSSRYLTVTGHHWPGSAETITEQQDSLDWLDARFMTRPKMSSSEEAGLTSHSDVSDDELLERISRSKQAVRFEALFAGDVGDDPSAADLALCNILAFWCRRDPEQMDRLFRRSGLIRSKWDKVHYADGRTYGQACIHMAIEDCQTIWDGASRQSKAGADQSNHDQSSDRNRADSAEIRHTADGWPDPQPVIPPLHPVDPFRTDLLPVTIRDWVADIAHRKGCPPDYAAVGAMVSLAAVVGAGIGIKPKRKDDWLVVPNLWGGVIGPPSKLKSPTLQDALKPLTRLEAMQNAAMAEKANDLEPAIRLKLLRKELEAAIKADPTRSTASAYREAKGGKKPRREQETVHRPVEEIKAEIRHLQSVENVGSDSGLQARFRTNDSTIEALHELLSDNPRGILVFRDELIGLLAGWERDGREQDRAFYLEAYNGYGTFPLDRILRGHVVCENMCVSILGGTQPDKVLRYLLKAHKGENDGLLQRFQLLVYPDAKPYGGIVDEYPNRHARETAFSVFDTLARANFASIAETGEYDKIPFLRYSDAGQDFFFDWFSDLHRTKIDDADNPTMLREWFGKQAKTFNSLALLTHLADRTEMIVRGIRPGPVAEDAASRAAGWCHYLESHARRIYGMVHSVEIQSAAALADKIRSGKLNEFAETGFTARDIYIKGWSQLMESAVVTAACNELVAAGWLRADPVAAGFQQRAFMRYWINPKALPT